MQKKSTSRIEVARFYYYSNKGEDFKMSEELSLKTAIRNLKPLFQPYLMDFWFPGLPGMTGYESVGKLYKFSTSDKKYYVNF